jgi:hypothetical protein
MATSFSVPSSGNRYRHGSIFLRLESRLLLDEPRDEYFYLRGRGEAMRKRNRYTTSQLRRRRHRQFVSSISRPVSSVLPERSVKLGCMGGTSRRVIGANLKRLKAPSAEGLSLRPPAHRKSLAKNRGLGLLFDGELFVIGRMKELSIVRGRNHSLDDIEATI